MRNTRIGLLVLTLFIGLTGCITIEEQYAFKKNGSGTMTYVLDMSEMGEMMKSFNDGKEKEDDGTGDMNITGHADALKTISGISKVKLDTKTKWVQKLSFTFADIGALNRALNTLMPDSARPDHEFFKWENGTLVRRTNNFVHNMSSAMASEAATEEDGEVGEESGFDMSSMLGMMKYKYSFKFQQPITTEASAAMAKEAGSKEVKLSTDWAAIAKDPKALDLRIAIGAK